MTWKCAIKDCEKDGIRFYKWGALCREHYHNQKKGLVE